MNIWRMAVRNLGRNRRRSFLAVLSVFIAITLVVFMDGLISGVVDSMARNFTKNETGQVNVTTTEYRQRERFMPASAAIPDSDAVVAAIRSTPGLSDRLVQVTPRALMGVVLSSGSATKVARLHRRGSADGEEHAHAGPRAPAGRLVPGGRGHGGGRARSSRTTWA